VYYELLKPSEIITGDLYRKQLMRLSRALKDKRPQYNERHDKVILQHDNARLHVTISVKTYLEMGSPTRHILHILLPLTIICFDQWHTVWLTSAYVLMKKSKIRSIRESPQKMSSFSDAGFVRFPKDGRK